MSDIDITQLGALTVLDPDGAVHELASIWAARLTVVAWVRHFG